MSRGEILLNGGKRILKKGESVEELMRRVYPNHPWDQLQFRPPPMFWRNQVNLAKALTAASQKLGIEQVRFFFLQTLHSSTTLSPPLLASGLVHCVS